MSGDSGETGKIYCGNCLHCKHIMAYADDGQKIEKVRCAAGHWKKKLGEEKFYKYATIGRRTKSACPDYDEMGELRSFIKSIKRAPLSKDDTYTDD